MSAGIFWLLPFTPQLWVVLFLTAVLFIPLMFIILTSAKSQQVTPYPHQALDAGQGLKKWGRMYLYSLFNGFSVLMHGEVPERWVAELAEHTSAEHTSAELVSV
jgi:hypothetical protein